MCKIMGLYYIPESKCLMSKLIEIVKQKKLKEWNMVLADAWPTNESNQCYYIDGHL